MRPSSLSDPIYRARPLTSRVAALAAALLTAACGGDEGPTDPGGGADCVGGVPTLSISFANSNLTPTGAAARTSQMWITLPALFSRMPHVLVYAWSPCTATSAV